MTELEIALANRPKRASYSAISTHETCGASYMYGYVLNIQQPSGPAAERGTRLHTSGEMFLKGELPLEKLPVDYWRVKKELHDLKVRKALSEQTWCVGRDWTIIHPNRQNGIFIKCIVDVHVYDRKEKVLDVADLKTGKIYREDHTDQLQLYGTVGLVKYPDAKAVRVRGLYIDQGKWDVEATYPRKMLPMLQKHWTERALKVLTDEEFKPNPSMANCTYCSYNKKRGGPCQAGV